MAKCEVFYEGVKIDSKNFDNRFFIIEDFDKKKLHWKVDNEEFSPPRSGNMKIWILNTQKNPRILDVLPDWQLTIDGVVMKRELYSDVDVDGKMIELEYKNYRFVFLFPKR